MAQTSERVAELVLVFLPGFSSSNHVDVFDVETDVPDGVASFGKSHVKLVG